MLAPPRWRVWLALWIAAMQASPSRSVLIDARGGIDSRAAGAYVGAVVEFAPEISHGQLTRAEALALMGRNLAQYSNFASRAKEQDADIIVFPEDGLYGYQFHSRGQILPYLEPVPELGVALCGAGLNGTMPVGTYLSCMALRNELVVVAVYGEVQECGANSTQPQACPADGRFQWNAQVAFDADGTVIGHYRKSHLYLNEPQFNQPAVPDPTVFVPSAARGVRGIRFGMAICYDIMFRLPVLSYTDRGIDTLTVGHWWVNTPPSMTATMFHQAFSRQLGITLLASNGVKTPAWNNSGAGIYDSGEILATWFNPGDATMDRLLVAKVPIRAPPGADREKNRAEKLELAAPAIGRPAGPGPVRPRRGGVPAAPAGQWGWQTFTAGPGVSVNLVSRSGRLACSGSVTFGPETVAGDTFGVLAFAGFWKGQYYEEHCGLYRCGALDSCIDPVELSSSTVQSLLLRADHDVVNLTPFEMAAANGAQLISQDLFITSHGKSQGRDFSLIEFLDGALGSTRLLAASIVAIDRK